MSTNSGSLCGPQELVAKLLEYRQGRRRQPEIFGNISDEGLRRLVVLSYFASQVVEEGRYPKFRFFVPAQMNVPRGWKDPWSLAKFDQPVIISDVDDLRRLAPCAASHDLALEVQEVCQEGKQSRVECCGIRLAHSGEGGAEIFSPSLWARSVRPGLMIRVDGPGELRVSEGHTTWDLRAGKMAHLGSVPLHPLPLWLDRLSKRLAKNDHQDRAINHTLHFAWSELLHLAAERRRGACLLVLPTAPLSVREVETDYEIRLKYPASEVGLGRAVAAFVETCLASENVPAKDGFKDAANRWLRDRHTLLSIVDSLAHFSAVDGCTVFDDDLQLIGFGGKINISNKTENKSFLDACENKPLGKELLARTGTRHLSAYRLCQAHDGVSCYVVSQDGQVTAMWSSHDAVHRWYPFWPWAKRSDHI